jgi:hypothetical protein
MRVHHFYGFGKEEAPVTARTLLLISLRFAHNISRVFTKVALQGFGRPLENTGDIASQNGHFAR